MSYDDFDDGLVHNHGWATEPAVIKNTGKVCHMAQVPTPSCVFHDDKHEEKEAVLF
jgi:hypothetical protein